MQLSPAAFNAHIARMGQDVMWRPSYRCPCFNPDSGAAKPTCPLCRGRGWTWGAEAATRIGLTNQNAKKAMEQFGTYEVGDALLTLPSDSAAYGAGRHARFRALNATNPFSEPLTRGDGDRLLGSIKSFTRCYWLNDAGTVEVEGGLPVADANGNLTWPSGGAPPAGKQYSLSGVRYDEYYLPLDLPVDRNHHAGAPLPRKVLARRLDLFGR